jgi:hypothetical protein
VSSIEIPSVSQLYWPTICALRELGGSGTVGEIVEKVIELEDFSEEQQAVPHTQGTRTALEYRLAWARTHLKMVDLLENSARGVWSLTDDGRRIGEHEVPKIPARVRAVQGPRPRSAQPSSLLELDEHVAEEAEEPDWKESLLSRLLELPPDGFERLAGRLLREAGFVNVTITGRGGDGGIDAVGVYRVSLLTFRFTCSARGIAEVSVPGPSATFAERWPAEETRACFSRQDHSPQRPVRRRQGTEPRRSTSLTATPCVSSSGSSESECGQRFVKLRTSS